MRGWLRVVAAWVGAYAAAWWMIGDLSETNPYRHGDLEYIVKPPSVSGTVVAAVGVAGTAIVVVTAVAALRAGRRTGATRDALVAVILAIVSGWLLAWCARLITAGSVGANIGGGFAMLFVAPFAVALLVVALRLGWRRTAASGSG